MRTKVGALADMDVVYNHGIGPLPMVAVVELLYRVSEIGYTFSGTEGSDSGSAAGTMVIAGAATELEQFVATSYNDPSLGDPQSIPLEGGTYGNTTTGHASMIAIKTGFEFEIYKDTGVADSYWLSGYLVVTAYDTSSGNPVGIHSSTTAAGTGSITLKLKCGDYVLRTNAPTDGGSATLTASKWFPFATTAGAAAWNTTTGAPANGGPGA